MPKNKNSRSRNNHFEDNWESVPLDEEFLSSKDFQNLVSIEVLNDYQIVNDKGRKVITMGGKRKRDDNDKVDEPDAVDEDGEVEDGDLIEGFEGEEFTFDDDDCAEDEDMVDFDEEVEVDQGSSIRTTRSIARKQRVSSTSSWEVEKLDTESENDEDLDDLSSGDEEDFIREESPKPTPKKMQKLSIENKETTKEKKKQKMVKGENNFNQNPEVKQVDESEFFAEDWMKLGVPDIIIKALREKGFNQPTPIQALTLPASILGKKDVVGAAETGSGKTLAFAIPILNGILSQKSEPQDKLDKSLKALILTPTRELAVQIQNHIKTVSKYTSIKVIVIVGGLSQQKQERLLKSQPEIVIGTPGRLWELMKEGNEHLSSLRQIKFLAVDETDRMVEKGHFKELEGILGELNKNPEFVKDRQNFVFSATLSFTHTPPPRYNNIVKKGRKNQGKNSTKISSVDKLNEIMNMIGIRDNPKVVDITSSKGTCEKLIERQISCANKQKDYYLYYFLMQNPGRTIVFCNSINCVRRISNLFSFLNCHPLPLHSEMVQKQRLKNLERFATDEKAILIATDVAARGLDIVDIQHVIHYQVPKTAESYIHRSGRTARAFKGGLALLLMEPAEKQTLTNICRSLGRDDLPDTFDVNGQVFRDIREIVDLAVKVEKSEHSLRKKTADINWMEKTKKEMDLATSDEDSDSGKKERKKNINKAKKDLEIQKKKLTRLQSVPFKGINTNLKPSTLMLNGFNTLNSSKGKEKDMDMDIKPKVK